MPDEPAEPARTAAPAPALLRLPTPEQLGVAVTAAADWSAAHRRFEQMGAVCFRLEKLAHGGCRVSCVLPTTQPDLSHRVEAEASSEAEAVRLALDKAEEWSATTASAR